MAMFYIKPTSLNDFPIEKVPVNPTGQFKQSLESFSATDSPLRAANIAQIPNVLFKLTSVNDFPLEEVPGSPTGQFKQSLDSFYVTDSPLSVTNIAQMSMFYTRQIQGIVGRAFATIVNVNCWRMRLYLAADW